MTENQQENPETPAEEKPANPTPETPAPEAAAAEAPAEEKPAEEKPAAEAAPEEVSFDGEVLATIKAPGPNPQGLAYDGENLWVADRDHRKIYKVSPEDGTPLFSIAFDGELAGTTWDGGKIWQADRTSRTISRIDPESGSIDVSIPVDLPSGDVSGLYHEDGGLWYGLSRLGQARKVKDTDGTFMRAFPTLPDICGLVVQGKFLFYTEPSEGKIHKMHSGAGAILISYRVKGRPTGLAYDGQAFWVADQEAGEVRRLKF